MDHVASSLGLTSQSVGEHFLIWLLLLNSSPFRFSSIDVAVLTEISVQYHQMEIYAIFFVNSKAEFAKMSYFSKAVTF